MKRSKPDASNKEKVLNQARKIMDDFLEALDEMPEAEDCFPRATKPLRDKEKSRENIDGLRELLFMNAPRHNAEYVLAEKKRWN